MIGFESDNWDNSDDAFEFLGFFFTIFLSSLSISINCFSVISGVCIEFFI